MAPRFGTDDGTLSRTDDEWTGSSDTGSPGVRLLVIRVGGSDRVWVYTRAFESG